MTDKTEKTLAEYVPGLTLRDYFAGQALALINHTTPTPTEEQFLTAAEFAYSVADAMLAEREKLRAPSPKRKSTADAMRENRDDRA